MRESLQAKSLIIWFLGGSWRVVGNREVNFWVARYPGVSAIPLPNSSSDNELLHSLAPYFLDWLAHPSDDEYCKRIAIEEHFGDIDVPSLTVAAWYDIFQGGSLRNYIGLKEHAAGEKARQGQRLLVTIGGHAGSSQKVGDVDFGPAAPFDEDAVTLDWYDHLFKSVANKFAGPKRVQIFVMGSNVWREEDDWPWAHGWWSRDVDRPL